MSGMPHVCYVAALVFMTMTHDCMSHTACECRLVCSVTSVDIIPGTRDGMSAATVGLRTSGTGQHWTRHRTQTSVISKQPPESGGHQSGVRGDLGADSRGLYQNIMAPDPKK